MDLDMNGHYYSTLKPGRRDYWRYMAAPLMRLETMMNVLVNTPPQKVIDLGCGDGSLLLAVSSRFPNAQLAGIDRSFSQIEENRKRNGSISWQAADFDSTNDLVPELNGKFDVALCMEVVEHVADPSRLLLHARGLVRPGGRLILSTQSGPLRETERRVGHRKHFSEEEMADLLKSNGWNPVRVWNSGWPFHDLSKWIANIFPDRSMRHFGDVAYSWSQKTICQILGVAFKLNSKKHGAQLFAVAEKP